MKMIKFPDIGQFRQVVKDIQHQARFVELDDNNEPIFDNNAMFPTLTCQGTTKIHGTNAGVCYDCSTKEIWAQSRENIITPQKDNAGFAMFVYSKKDVFLDIFKLISALALVAEDKTITIFGEWCGAGIQKGVGVSNLDKSFFIFGIKISKPDDETFTAYWVDYSEIRSPENRIFNILDYPTYEIEVDFNNPELSQNKFVEIVDKVELECPVAKAFGFEGIGEGVVFTCKFKNTTHRFKCKGQKHSVSKVRAIGTANVEKITSCKEFAEYTVTENRVKQACEKVLGIGAELDIKKTGDIIRWVINDIIKEELDTLVENGLEPKDVNSYLATNTKQLYMGML